jgi:glycosyltransferase involved in cell wall biosynthesis
MRTKRRVLLVQPSIRPPGGGNGVAAWMLEALKGDHRLSLLSWRAPDLSAVNRFFGTSLRSSDFRLMVPPHHARAAARCSPTPLSLLKSNYLSRLGRHLAREHDVILTANNESDLGGRGIQYVHFPSLLPVRPKVDLHWYHSRFAVAVYRRYAQRLTGFRNERMRRNLTLVNSDWTGNLVRRLHGIEARTVRPPVPGSFPALPWRDREDGFVCIGRLSPEKRIELIIEILLQVRAHGHPAHLHIVGTFDDRAYGRRIRRLVDANRAWVFLETNLARDELARLAAQHRYGIHGMAEEHFGMAVAEMIRAGCIVFAPNGGGQVEIVGNDRLLYNDATDAVMKVGAVLSDRDAQAELHADLATKARTLSAERFVVEIREIVRDF